jgi:hypothetical protein
MEKWCPFASGRALTWINVNAPPPPQFASHRPGAVEMESEVSDLVVGLMMAAFGLVGLFLVAGAADNEMYVFGFALCVFAVCFNAGLIRHYFDRRDAVRAALREPSHV